MKQSSIQNGSPIKLLIVDDSWVLRKVLRGTLSQREDIEIIGEATNGIQALEMILKNRPDVILLDMEMPTMDGMTTLQHLMIHMPTPTIMLSSLSKRGTARCFDALKYGAVAFISKNSFFRGMDGAAHSKLVLKTIYNASKIIVKSINPMQQGSETGALQNKYEEVIFCEECGTRQVVENVPLGNDAIKCRDCGDEIFLYRDKRYRRINYITVIGTGDSGYSNLLKIIPELNPEMGGALCIVILDRPKYVQSFVKYLDAICDIEVIFGQNGTILEGGCCYLFSGDEHVQVSPYSGHFTLQMDDKETDKKKYIDVIDTLMISVASLMKTRATGILLSGSTADGKNGMERILQEKGTCFILNPSHCLQKTMVDGSFERDKLSANLDETALAIEIKKCHFANKEKVTTA